MDFSTPRSHPGRPDCAARLAAYLCERNTVTHNPVKGVKRPPAESYVGKTPALGDHQAWALLYAPEGVSVKGKRDRRSWPPCSLSITRCAAPSCAN